MGDVQIPTAVTPLTSTDLPMQKDAASQVPINSITSNPEQQDPPLFSPSLISSEVTALLPEDTRYGRSGGVITMAVCIILNPSRVACSVLSSLAPSPSSLILTPSTLQGPPRPHARATRADKTFFILVLAGFLPTLRVLTTVGEPTVTEFNARYDFMSSRNDTYYILVICDSDQVVVGTGAVIVERKFIHNLGLVGHIEDIAVAKNQQGKKLGLRIIQALDHVAEQVGCYKSILDCSEANEGFYVKCGFKRAGLEMAHYYEKGPKTSYEKS